MAGRFHHLVTHSPPSWGHRWKAIRTGLLLPYTPDSNDVTRIPALAPASAPQAPPGAVAATWVGHASFLLQLPRENGEHTYVLTDPVWSVRLPGRLGRLQPPGVPWGELPRIDAVVVSHNHYDHMDRHTLEKLPRTTRMFVPLGTGRWFRIRGFRHVHEMAWWQSATFGGVRFEFVPAHHWSRRRVMDKNDTLWGGWVVTPKDRPAVYFAGDTAYGEAFTAIARRHPEIELAILPIGAYTPRWHEKGVHMNPEEAIQAFQDLGAKTMVPMHWGTFPIAPEPVMEPHDRLVTAWKASGLPDHQLANLPIGGTRIEMPQQPVLPPKLLRKLDPRPNSWRMAWRRLLHVVAKPQEQGEPAEATA